jgi:hypothetical protein
MLSCFELEERGGSVLEAIPTDWLSTNVRLQQNDEVVGEVDVSPWSEKARLELLDGTYTLRREGFFKGDFLLERDGSVIARATKPGIFQGSFDVEMPNRRLSLRKASIWNRRFALFDGDKQIGTVYPTGMFTRRSNIDLPPDLPLATRIFVFWLALISWKRQSGAAGS